MTGLVDAPCHTENACFEPVVIRCRDCYVLHGHLWHSAEKRGRSHGTIIVNPATGVLARYYHAFASFLASHGFTVLTYD
jgi:predicted alpha/beta hydrolase